MAKFGNIRETLLIRLPSADDADCGWVILDGDGRRQGDVSRGPLAEAAPFAKGRRVVVLIPGAEVLLTDVKIPGANRQRVSRAVPFALEEQLADDVEELHFAIGKAQAVGEYPVAIVARERMDHWTARLREAALFVEQMIPETLLLPCEEGKWTVLIDRSGALVRTGPYSGFTSDIDNLGTLLSGALSSGDEELPQLYVLVADRAMPPELNGMEAELRMERLHGEPLELLADGYVPVPPLDLLQGRYGRKEELGRLWRPWRATAALLLIGVVLGIVTLGVEYWQLRTEQARLTARIDELYRQTFPGRKLVNARVQMQQQLEQLQRGKGGGGEQFLSLLAKTGEVLVRMPGVDLNAVSFRAGRLDLDLSARDLQMLDQLKQALVDSGGLEVDIQSATADANQKVQSRLRIQRLGS
jgi:general secretion pathway protein L